MSFTISTMKGYFQRFYPNQRLLDAEDRRRRMYARIGSTYMHTRTPQRKMQFRNRIRKVYYDRKKRDLNQWTVNQRSLPPPVVDRIMDYLGIDMQLPDYLMR